MQPLVRLTIGLLKYFLFSLFVSAVTFVGGVSLMSGKFPPKWEDIKGARKSVESILVLRKQISEQGGVNNFQHHLQKMALPTAGEAAATAGEYADPALEDVKELFRHRNNQAALSQTLSGRVHLASAIPQQAVAPVQSEAPAPADAEVTERVRKLEDLVGRMHEKIQRLNQELAALKQQNQHR